MTFAKKICKGVKRNGVEVQEEGEGRKGGEWVGVRSRCEGGRGGWLRRGQVVKVCRRGEGLGMRSSSEGL